MQTDAPAPASDAVIEARARKNDPEVWNEHDIYDAGGPRSIHTLLSLERARKELSEEASVRRPNAVLDEIEKAARAICRTFIINAFKPHAPPSETRLRDLVDEEWPDWSDHARAVLASRSWNAKDSSGYVEAFYKIAEVLGIGAQPLSPKEAFETQMLPKIKRLASLAQDAAPVAQWRYEICHGPDGEQNYAFVYDSIGDLVGNLKIHHAIAVVRASAAPPSAATIRADAQVLKRIEMALRGADGEGPEGKDNYRHMAEAVAEELGPDACCCAVTSAKERERCAKIAEEHAKVAVEEGEQPGEVLIAMNIAAAIRAAHEIEEQKS